MEYATPPTYALDAGIVLSAVAATYQVVNVNINATSGLALVVSRLMQRAGLSPAQYDVSGIAAISKPVRALTITQVSTVRATLEMLMSVYYFEATVSDKIYFRARGGVSVATIPHADLGAAAGSTPSEPLALTLATDVELPAQVTVTYANTLNDYLADTQSSDRLVTAMTDTTLKTTFPMGMTPQEAKGVADTMTADQRVALVTTTICLPAKYAALEPTDVVLAEAADGSVYRLRLLKKTDLYPMFEFDAVADDASVLTSQGVTPMDYSQSLVVAGPVAAVMLALDIPLLRDADNDAGFYVAGKGDGVPFPGCAIYSSVDDVEYQPEASLTESATFGTALTALGAWTGPRVFDESHTVMVNMGSGGLVSITRDALLGNCAYNALLLGNELLQYRTATLVSTGVYILAGLLRGCRGTEAAMATHAIGERAVAVGAGGVARVALLISGLGVSRYYKAVTFGRAVSTATGATFIDTGEALRPFSPVDLRGARDGPGNLTLTWQRRTRMATRMIGTLGISVPLGEDAESYTVKLYAAGYGTLKRTITATSATAAYSAADQTADFGSPQATVYARVYQNSAQVGLGNTLEGTA